MTKLGDLERNDVPAAVRYVEERLDAEQDLSPDDGQVLRMLQDDPEELVAALHQLYQRRQARGLAVPSFWEE